MPPLDVLAKAKKKRKKKAYSLHVHDIHSILNPKLSLGDWGNQPPRQLTNCIRGLPSGASNQIALYYKKHSWGKAHKCLPSFQTQCMPLLHILVHALSLGGYVTAPKLLLFCEALVSCLQSAHKLLISVSLVSCLWVVGSLVAGLQVAHNSQVAHSLRVARSQVACMIWVYIETGSVVSRQLRVEIRDRSLAYRAFIRVASRLRFVYHFTNVCCNEECSYTLVHQVLLQECSYTLVHQVLLQERNITP